MKTIYLMRHGETLFNLLGKVQGSCDSPLTKKGIEQAKSARKYFEREQITFDHYFSSTQERASDTLELASGVKEYTRLKNLKEWDFGMFEGERQSLQPKHPGEPTHGDFYIQFGGENYEQVVDRMHHAIEEILAFEGETFLAVSHAGALYCYFLSLALEKHPEVHFSNCYIFKYEFDENNVSLTAVIDPVNDKIYE